MRLSGGWVSMDVSEIAQTEGLASRQFTVAQLIDRMLGWGRAPGRAPMRSGY